MGSGLPNRFVVRLPLWRVWARLAVVYQAVAAVLLVVLLTALVVTQLTPFDVSLAVFAAGVSAIAFVVSLPAALDRWRANRVALTGEGLFRFRRFWKRWEAEPYILWAEVAVVQRRRGWQSGRLLRVVAESGREVVMPERPADFDGFREAVERWAGEAHPLARALAEVAEEG